MGGVEDGAVNLTNEQIKAARELAEASGKPGWKASCTPASSGGLGRQPYCQQVQFGEIYGPYTVEITELVTMTHIKPVPIPDKPGYVSYTGRKVIPEPKPTISPRAVFVAACRQLVPDLCDTIADRDRRIAELEKQLAELQTKYDRLDSWAEDVRDR